MGNPGGDPVWPGRSGAMRLMTQDRSHYTAGKLEPLPGGLEYADDVITAFLQGSSQFDALGHTWYDGELYNGFDAETTTGGMAKCGVDKLAKRGIVGRGVLIDMARHRSKAALETRRDVRRRGPRGGRGGTGRRRSSRTTISASARAG